MNANVHPGLGSGPALVAEADLHSGPVVAEEQAVAHANDRAARCPVLASTLRYPTAISEYAPATEAEAPDPGGAAQVSDVAPNPALPVEDGPALPLEDGPALGTQVHDRGPALATPGPGFGATQVHGPAFDTQVSGRGPDLDTLMSGPALAAEDIILATQVSNAAPDPGLLVDHGAADGGDPPPVANILTF